MRENKKEKLVVIAVFAACLIAVGAFGALFLSFGVRGNAEPAVSEYKKSLDETRESTETLPPETIPQPPATQPDETSVPLPTPVETVFETISEEPPTEVITGRPVVKSYPVLSSDRADDSFFNDAVFVGDSRTQGLQLYGELKNATYYAYQGLNVITAQNNNFINDNGEQLTIAQAIARHPELKKIYICLGVNEFWMAEGTYKANYEVFIDSIMDANPNAAIYIYAITPLFDGYFQQNSVNGLNNDKMAKFNQIGKEIAIARGIYYVDVTEAFTKPDGRRYLDSSESSDGIHLNNYGVKKLTDYFRTHTK